MLSVDVGRMRDVDTRNVENLHGMWSGKHEVALHNSRRETK